MEEWTKLDEFKRIQEIIKFNKNNKFKVLRSSITLSSLGLSLLYGIYYDAYLRKIPLGIHLVIIISVYKISSIYYLNYITNRIKI